MNEIQPDKGARNIVRVFLGVVFFLLIFYSALGYQSLTWSPMFYVKNAGSERSRINFEGEENAVPMKYQSVERGKKLFLREGCSVCHGQDGRGGVANPNYINKTTPRLDEMAERLFLYEHEDVDLVLKVFESGKSLDEVEDLDIPRANAVIAQYKSIVTLIQSGNPAGKEDQTGHSPFDMPAFKGTLNQRDVNDVIAYLLSIYRWEGK
ncbi:MAG: cytochrome c [Planctomycetes bacterium]|nr:cytochrome c [Planctomycetota bacterium]